MVNLCESLMFNKAQPFPLSQQSSQFSVAHIHDSHTDPNLQIESRIEPFYEPKSNET